MLELPSSAPEGHRAVKATEEPGLLELPSSVLDGHHAVEAAKGSGVLKALARKMEDNFAVKQFSVEGPWKFSALLYVLTGRAASAELFVRPNCQMQSYVKLYVRDRLIIDVFERGELLPDWLHMVKGAFVFEDLPPVSRGDLQRNEIFLGIKKDLVKRCLEMFAEFAEKKERVYSSFVQWHPKIQAAVQQFKEFDGKKIV